MMHNARYYFSTVFFLTVVFSVSALIFAPATYASSGSEQEEKVIAKGVGMDFEGAKTDAIRNAITQVVGSYVTSETHIQNFDLINDEVLTYSAGFVKDVKILGKRQDASKLHHVDIEAVVVSTRIKRKLEELNIATRDVEGQSLFAEAFSRVEEQKSAAQLLEGVLSKFPQAAYIIEVGKPEIVSTNQATKMAKVNFPIQIKWDQAFIGDLKNILGQVSKETIERIKADEVKNRHQADRSANLCFSRERFLRNNTVDICYILQMSDLAIGGLKCMSNDKKYVNARLSKEDFYSQTLSEFYGITCCGKWDDTLRMTVDFFDKNNRSIDMLAITLIEPIEKIDQALRKEIGNLKTSDNFVFHTLSSDGVCPNSTAVLGRCRTSIIIEDMVTSINGQMEMRIDDLQNITRLEARIEPLPGTPISQILSQ